jgi:hypothetical protein
MLRKILYALSASLLLSASSLTVQAVNLFANPGFEAPAFSGATVTQLPDTNAGGWRTTHPSGAFCTSGGCRPIEFWSNSVGSVPSGQGVQHIEINAYFRSMIFQPIVLSGGKLNWSFLHRGRGSDTSPDVAELRIGIPGGLPTGSLGPDSYSYSIVRVGTTANGTFITPSSSGTVNPPMAVGNGWVRYSGTYTYTPTAGTPPTVNVGFLAVSTAGNNVSAGNFIDDASVDRDNPCCPPWNSTQLAQHMFHVGSGSIAAPYTLRFQTSPALNNQMQTYIEYLNAGNSSITSITIAWILYDQGTGNAPLAFGGGGNGTAVSGPFWQTWTANGASTVNTPTPAGAVFFPGFPMQPGRWYAANTGNFPNNGLRVFPTECDNHIIYYRVQLILGMKGSNPMYEIRNSRGETIGRGEVKNRAEILPPDRRQNR